MGEFSGCFPWVPVRRAATGEGEEDTRFAGATLPDQITASGLAAVRTCPGVALEGDGDPGVGFPVDKRSLSAVGQGPQNSAKGPAPSTLGFLLSEGRQEADGCLRRAWVPFQRLRGLRLRTLRPEPAGGLQEAPNAIESTWMAAMASHLNRWGSGGHGVPPA